MVVTKGINPNHAPKVEERRALIADKRVTLHATAQRECGREVKDMAEAADTEVMADGT